MHFVCGGRHYISTQRLFLTLFFGIIHGSVQETICGVGDQTGVFMWGKYLPSYTIFLAPEIITYEKMGLCRYNEVKVIKM